MTTDALPDEVVALLREQRVTLESLDVLLLLFRACECGWRVPELASKLAVSEASLLPLLEDLAGHGLVRVMLVARDTVWFYAPRDASLAGAVARIAAIDEVQRLELMRCLGALALDRVRRSAARAFSDAFGERRKRPDR